MRLAPEVDILGMGLLEKIQKKPEKFRNRIFWLALIISVVIVGFFWIKSLGNSLEKLKIESKAAGKSSKDFIEEIKKESPLSQLKEGINKFEGFLESDEFKKSFK